MASATHEAHIFIRKSPTSKPTRCRQGSIGGLSHLLRLVFVLRTMHHLIGLVHCNSKTKNKNNQASIVTYPAIVSSKTWHPLAKGFWCPGQIQSCRLNISKEPSPISQSCETVALRLLVHHNTANTAQHNTTQHNTTQHGTARHNTTQHDDK